MVVAFHMWGTAIVTLVSVRVGYVRSLRFIVDLVSMPTLLSSCLLGQLVLPNALGTQIAHFVVSHLQQKFLGCYTDDKGCKVDRHTG